MNLQMTREATITISVRDSNNIVTLSVCWDPSEIPSCSSNLDEIKEFVVSQIEKNLWINSELQSVCFSWNYTCWYETFLHNNSKGLH